MILKTYLALALTALLLLWSHPMSVSLTLGAYRAHFAGRTDVGRIRSHNEDSFWIPGDLPLAIVADGMGGHASGDVASRVAVETISGHFAATAHEDPPTWPVRLPLDHVQSDRTSLAVKLANSRIHELGNQDPDRNLASPDPHIPTSPSSHSGIRYFH